MELYASGDEPRLRHHLRLASPPSGQLAVMTFLKQSSVIKVDEFYAG